MTAQVATAGSGFWASLARRAAFACLAVAVLGLGVVMAYWGAILTVVVATAGFPALLLTPVAAGFAVLPVAAGLASLVAALTDRPSWIAWAIALAAVELAVLATVYGVGYLIS